LIGRLALLKSVSPTQKKFAKPPPDPVELMSIETSGFASEKSSATAVISGKTVLDPAMLIDPESPASALSLASSEPASLELSPLELPESPPSVSVQPASASAPAPARAASDRRRVIPSAVRGWLDAITARSGKRD